MTLFWLGMILVLLVFLPEVSREGRGEKLAFAGMWALAGLYGTLVVAEVPLPNITEAIIFALTAIYEWLGPA